MKMLKKVFLWGLACLHLIVPLSVSAENKLNDTDLPRVVDEADLLSGSEKEELTGKIENLTDKYGFDIVIVTAQTIDGKTPAAYADDYYDYGGYGAGYNNDGVLLLISMEDRDWWISTTGYGISAFTDYGIDFIGDEIVPYLSDGSYYKAFTEFLSLTDDFLAEAEKGTPYDIDHKYKAFSNYIIAVGIGLLIGLIIAVISVLIMKSKMKTVAMQHNANNYAINNSLKLDRFNDIFIYRNVTKTIRPEPSSSVGSSIHTGSSGTSHGGGGGKF